MSIIKKTLAIGIIGLISYIMVIDKNKNTSVATYKETTAIQEESPCRGDWKKCSDVSEFFRFNGGVGMNECKMMTDAMYGRKFKGHGFARFEGELNNIKFNNQDFKQGIIYRYEEGDGLNGFGNWIPVTAYCTYNLNTGEVMNLEIGG